MLAQKVTGRTEPKRQSSSMLSPLIEKFLKR
jgi:hypothetical protein